jgi:acyl-ACP thioesterase
MRAARHVESFPIRAFECDPHGRLLPRTLCLLLQETAAAHASELGVAVQTLLDRGVAWVLSQLSITVEHWPMAGETLHIETWPAAASGTRIERRFRLLDGDGAVHGEATTLWLVMDLERRRPVRLPEYVTETFGPLVEAGRPARLDAIAPLAAPQLEQTLTVAYGDLDMVHHANNAAFVEWMVSCVAGSLWDTHDPAAIEVHYLSECRLGDTIVSRCGPADDGEHPTAVHSLVRTADDAEVARARSVWRPRTADGGNPKTKIQKPKSTPSRDPAT